MKKIIALLSLLVAGNAYADTCATNLMPAFTANQATALCTKLGDSIAESLIPQSDNAIDLGSASKTWRTLYTGTSRIAKTSDILRVRQDAQRLFTWDASSDTAFTATFGDAGTTAAQVLTISGSTADADDDAEICIAGGGACDTSGLRGGTIQIRGNENTAAGDVLIQGGSAANSGIEIKTLHASSNIVMQSGAGTTALTIESDQDLLMTGDLVLADGQNLGFVAGNAANQACDTTCTGGCVMGYDAGTSAFVGCGGATADTCICTK